MKYSLSNIWQMARPTPDFNSHIVSKAQNDYPTITSIKTKTKDGNTQIQKMEYDHRGNLNMQTVGHQKYHYKINENEKCAETLIFQGKYLIGRHSYIYDNDERLIKIFEFGGRNQKLKQLHTFEYNIHNQLSGHHIFSAYLNDYLSRSFYQWTNENISAKITFNHKKEKIKTLFTFDTQRNTNYQHPLFIRSVQGWNKNNILQKKQTICESTSGRENEIIDFKIDFHKSGLIKDITGSNGQKTAFSYSRIFSIL
ncbi:hypothetical protein [Membranihabitans marinus]|uniref:hypothetical protein n=1 Tax=Membranihabitans marinus TaxID=1227546 RepID=UPI001F32AFBA|nr:hypothetical protein [Membranihabitans marinus]